MIEPSLVMGRGSTNYQFLWHFGTAQGETIIPKLKNLIDCHCFYHWWISKLDRMSLAFHIYVVSNPLFLISICYFHFNISCSKSASNKSRKEYSETRSFFFLPFFHTEFKSAFEAELKNILKNCLKNRNISRLVLL